MSLEQALQENTAALNKLTEILQGGAPINAGNWTTSDDKTVKTELDKAEVTETKTPTETEVTTETEESQPNSAVTEDIEDKALRLNNGNPIVLGDISSAFLAAFKVNADQAKEVLASVGVTNVRNLNPKDFNDVFVQFKAITGEE